MQQLKTCKRKTLDDEFYTMYKDCVRELHKYDLREKKLYVLVILEIAIFINI